MSKEESFGKLAEMIMQENPTPELRSQATQLVFGSGDINTDIVFIGEAPGKREDKTGEPFVGAAGKFLNEMLESVGLKRADVYITNIVKYRPPSNRDPLPEEKTAFWPYLLRQLAIIRPKLVVTLGRHSGEAFLPNLRISTDHGKVQKVPVLLENKETTLHVLPLYHPAAALYNGGLRKTLLEDFQVIPRLLQTI